MNHGLLHRRLLAATLSLCAYAVPAQAASADAYATPARPGQPITAAFFGMHLHALVANPRALQEGEQATAWPEGQIGRLRLWDSEVRWADLEPQAGRWQWQRMDRYLDAATARGVPVLYTLGSTPAWASARPWEPCPYGRGCAAEPADWADWERYVRAVALRYRGRIEAYEVWNEPHPSAQPPQRPGFYSGNWDTLMELTRRTRAVLQAVDPQARLYTPGFDGNPAVLDEFYRRGGAALTDGVAFHFYGAGDDHVLPLAATLRATMARHGVAGRPLIDSESSHGAPEVQAGGAPNAVLNEAYTLRSLILMAWAGLETSYHHAWDNGHTGMVSRRGADRPLRAAYAQVRGWLLGTEPLGCKSRQAQPNGPLWVECQGRQGEHTLRIVWRADAAPTAPYPLPTGLALARVESATPNPAATLLGAGRTVPIGAMPVALWLTP